MTDFFPEILSPAGNEDMLIAAVRGCRIFGRKVIFRASKRGEFQPRGTQKGGYLLPYSQGKGVFDPQYFDPG